MVALRLTFPLDGALRQATLGDQGCAAGEGSASTLAVLVSTGFFGTNQVGDPLSLRYWPSYPDHALESKGTRCSRPLPIPPLDDAVDMPCDRLLSRPGILLPTADSGVAESLIRGDVVLTRVIGLSMSSDCTSISWTGAEADAVASSVCLCISELSFSVVFKLLNKIGVSDAVASDCRSASRWIVDWPEGPKGIGVSDAGVAC